MENKYSETSLRTLRTAVGDFLSEKRYAHTLEVEREAEYISGFVCPDKTGEIRAAALLHDIAKELSSEKQLNYVRGFDIIASEAEAIPPSVLHAAAAPGAVRELFFDYATDEILSAVRFHTTGRNKMTLFDTVIFVADYTEASRRHENCRRCRQMLHSGLKSAKGQNEAVRALAEAALYSLSETVAYLSEQGKAIDSLTLDAMRFFEAGGVPK